MSEPEIAALDQAASNERAQRSSGALGNSPPSLHERAAVDPYHDRQPGPARDAGPSVNFRRAPRRSDALTATDLIRYAGQLGLDAERFARDLRDHTGQAKIAADVDSADLSGVSGTPTFFINGKRHHGAYDINTLSNAVRAARARTLISPPSQARRAS